MLDSWVPEHSPATGKVIGFTVVQKSKAAATSTAGSRGGEEALAAPVTISFRTPDGGAICAVMNTHAAGTALSASCRPLCG